MREEGKVHISFTPITTRIEANSTIRCVAHFKNIWEPGTIYLQEKVYALFINQQYNLICWKCINSGSSNSTLIDCKLILTIALNCAASKIVIAHNHPGGGLRPSQMDIGITDKLKEVCDVLDIELLDHIIMTGKDYYSFMENNLIKK